MSPEEIEAYDFAKDLVLQASREWWTYLSLSPLHFGTGAKRDGFEALAALTILPKEISLLSHCEVIELRGTSVRDLMPLRGLPSLRDVNFQNIPACDADPNLAAISRILEAENKIFSLINWLEDHTEPEPPEPRHEGPVFLLPDSPPIVLVDAGMDEGSDFDQKELLDECRDKAASLREVAILGANSAPRLERAIEKYVGLIDRPSNQIGARSIWSHANTLASVLEVHIRATDEGRQSEELPPSVAFCLDDLLQTHQVWFLGHPGARQVEARAMSHRKTDGARARREAAIRVVEAAESSFSVSKQATIPARENIETSLFNTPSGVAALGELEDWAWNFLATISRKLWAISKNPPGGWGPQTIGGYYLVQFVLNNEATLGIFAREVMAQSPMWWEVLLANVRRVSDRNTDNE
jgi:hypothetical protein